MKFAICVKDTEQHITIFETIECDSYATALEKARQFRLNYIYASDSPAWQFYYDTIVEMLSGYEYYPNYDEKKTSLFEEAIRHNVLYGCYLLDYRAPMGITDLDFEEYLDKWGMPE